MDDNELRDRAHQYLYSIRLLDQRIDQEIIQLEQWRQKALSVGATDYSRVIVQSSHDNTMENIVANIVDMQGRINAQIDALVQLKEEASALIDQLEIPIDRSILRYRYICLCSIDDIANRVGYDKRHVIRLCNRGLKALGKKMSPNVTSECGKLVS